MSRIRTIKPQFFLNEELAELPPMARLLFIGLWVQADKEGRLLDRPKRIKAQVFPYDDFDVDIGLNNLAEYGFIIRYIHRGSIGEASGKHRGNTGEAPHIIQIVNFKKHQRITGKEADMESLFPPPVDFQSNNEGETSGKHRGNIGEAPEKHPGRQERNKEGNMEYGIRNMEGKGIEAVLEKKFLVPEMQKIWKKAKPDYPEDRIKDFTALQAIAVFLAEQSGLNYHARKTKDDDTIYELWAVIAKFVASHSFYKNYSLHQVEKHIQNITQTIKNGESDSKNKQSGSNKATSEQINAEFANFYSQSKQGRDKY